MSNNEKLKIKRKTKPGLNPITITIVSLGAFVMLLSVGVFPELMGNSVTKESYLVVYDSNGGTGSMKSQKITKGKATKLNSNKYTKEGYSFNGWRAYRNDGMWNCYLDDSKTITDWTVQSYCNKYGYSLYSDNVYVKDIVSSDMKVTMFADWKKN